jgi:PhzF family phenazine biosynthesis protein
VTGLLYTQVDVFSEYACRGNPVAVVHDASDLSAAAMARFARWTNLSETTFLLPPTTSAADYRLRIFTPGGELPFAGHPTLGSCHAWLEAGGVAAGVGEDAGQIVQECDAGLVCIRRQDDLLWFAAPPRLRSGPLEEALLARLLTACGLPRSAVLAHEWVDNGPGWCGLLLDSAERVRSVRPDLAALADVSLGLVGAHAAGGEAQFELRAFVPGLGVPEDPVTGSLNASVAQWLIGAGIAPDRYVASQGAVIGRAGRINVERDGDAIWVGGATHSIIRGRVSL